MDARTEKIRKIIALALTAALITLIMMMLSIQVTLAEGNDGENDEDKPDISIEVVEDIPAEDIEEQEVPLAESPMTAAAGSMRKTVVSWTLGAVALAYAAFIISGMRRRRIRSHMSGGSSGGSTDNGGE